MSERFWHSWLCLYQRERLLEKYPKLKRAIQLLNVVIKNFDWENYIYKGLLIAQYVQENAAPDKYEHYYSVILDNLDVFNYIIKYADFQKRAISD